MAYNREQGSPMLDFFCMGLVSLVISLVIFWNDHNLKRGSVRTENDLYENVIYVTNYSSETEVAGGYLAILEERQGTDGKLKSPRVYLLPSKPKASFSVSLVNGIIKYEDAVEVR